MGTESQHFENYDHLEPIPRKYAFAIISGSFIFFLIINWFTSSKGHPDAVPAKDEWKWRNLYVSWIHALVVGSWDLSCFILYPEMITDLIGYQNFSIYSMVAFSTGYFLYDFMDIVFNRKYNASWEVLLHHIAVSSMFIYNLMTSRCLAYTVVALMAEINSFFLHSRKLMQMQKVPFSSLIYRVNVYMNLFTFVICRFFALVWIVWGMVWWYERVGINFMWSLSASIFVMWIINIVLFIRLIKNDILRSPFKKPKICNGVDHVSANNNGPLESKIDSVASDARYVNDKHETNHRFSNGFKTS